MSGAMSAADVEQRLVAGGRDGLWEYRGLSADGTEHVIVTAAGHRRAYPLAAMARWLRWHAAGVDAGVDVADTTAQLAAVRTVLIRPELDDVWRLTIWAAMERHGQTITNIAEITGRNRTTVSKGLALAARRRLARPLAEELARAARAGRLPRRPAHPDAARVFDVNPPAATGGRRMWILAAAAEARLVEWVDPLDPNDAFRATAFTLRRGDLVDQVPAAHVHAAVAGVADALDVELAARL